MLAPEVIYENENFLAINKPAGLMVHGVRIAEGKQRDRAAEPTLVDWLMKKYPQVKTVGDDPAVRPGIVHRLDKDTSGIMLIPKTQEYFAYLKSLFQKHEIKKTYLAVVRGVPKNKEGMIDAPIGITNGSLKRSIRSKKMAKEAVTEYKVLRAWESGALLQVNPKTGRTHQIRVHLASIGHPIVGDKLYGGRTSRERTATSRLMLHAASIEFRDRDGSRVHLSTEAPFAKDL